MVNDEKNGSIHMSSSVLGLDWRNQQQQQQQQYIKAGAASVSKRKTDYLRLISLIW